jgi:hypothetical protein
MPERFGNAGQNGRKPGWSSPVIEPLAKALELLMPAPPAEPHALMDPALSTEEWVKHRNMLLG